MATFAVTGYDGLTINERPIIHDLADGSVIEIQYQNDRVGISTGKDGNTVFADNRQGNNAVLNLRVLRGTPTDRWLNGLSAQQDKDFVAFELLRGAFAKRIGDGKGNVSFDTYTLLGGAFQRYPDVSENNQGETEQGVTIYQIIFADVSRAIA